MVFLDEILPLSHGQMANVWLMAHFQKKLNKRQINKTNVSDACEGLIQPTQPIALRHYGQCLIGLSRIHLRQVEYLHADCNEVFSKLKLTFRKSNVDLPEKQKRSNNAITLPEEKDNEYDNNILSIDPNASENDLAQLLNQQQISDIGSNINLNIRYNDPNNSGSGSNGLGMIGLSTNEQLNQLQEINDNRSISSFGNNISDIHMNINQFQAKEHEIMLDQGSQLRRISFDGSGIGRISLEGGLSLEGDTQDVDIEIDFDDEDELNNIEFDENEATRDDLNNISIEQGRGMLEQENSQQQHGLVDINMSGIDGPLSAIKGPNQNINVDDEMSDVASFASFEKLSHNDEQLNLDISYQQQQQMAPLDESMRVQPIDNVPQIDIDAASVAESVNSVSTTDLNVFEQKIRERDEFDDFNEIPTPQRSKKNKNKRNLTPNVNEQPSRKKYKKTHKIRFPKDDKIELEDNERYGIDENGIRNENYILDERDVLHIWREHPLRLFEFEELMQHPITIESNIFGGGFTTNEGNFKTQFEKYMPSKILQCYNNIINRKPIEENEINPSSQEDLLGEMFLPHHNQSEHDDDIQSEDDNIELGRDNINNESLDHELMQDMDNMSMEMEQPIDDQSSLKQTTLNEPSLLEPQRLNLDDQSADESHTSHDELMNMSVLDHVVNDNVPNLDAELDDDHIKDTILEMRGNGEENPLHTTINVDISEEDEDEDIKELKAKQKKKENDKLNELQNKLKSWSRRTQKTFQYLKNRDGNQFGFNAMMDESRKRDTVAGVFYEMLVLKNADLIDLEQNEPYGDITISKTEQFGEYIDKVQFIATQMSQAQM